MTAFPAPTRTPRIGKFLRRVVPSSGRRFAAVLAVAVLALPPSIASASDASSVPQADTSTTSAPGPESTTAPQTNDVVGGTSSAAPSDAAQPASGDSPAPSSVAPASTSSAAPEIPGPTAPAPDASLVAPTFSRFAALATTNATIRVHKGGDRNADGTIAPLQGATFEVFSDSSLTTIVGSCVTDATGTCAVAVTANGSQDFWVREASGGAPAGYSRIDQVATSADGVVDYVQRIDNIASGATVDTRTFANRVAPNPAYPSTCGLKVAMVFDLSNSIDSSELATMKAAGAGFANALVGTPSSIAVYTFATNAPASGNTNLGLTNVLTSASTVTSKINGLTEPGGNSGGTNWDMALRQVRNSGADVVLMLTDGDPTFYGTADGDGLPTLGPGSSTAFDEIEAGVFSANAVKRSQRLVVVGIGVPAGSTNNLAALSGPTAWNGANPGNAGTADYFGTSFNGLGDVLAGIAKAACGGTVTVKKQVETSSGTWTDSNGWAFGATTSSGTVTPASGQTATISGNPGLIQFALTGLTWPKTVTVTETLDPNYTLTPQGGTPRNATCLRDGTAISAADITDTANGVSLSVGIDQSISCTFRNTPKPASIQVWKQTTGGVGGPFSFTATKTGGGGPVNVLSATTTAGTNPAQAGTWSGLFPGTYTLSESAAPSGWNPAGATCDDLGTAGVVETASPTNLVVGANSNWKCTFTNDLPTTTIRVKKTSVGATGAFNFTLNGASTQSVDTGVTNPGTTSGWSATPGQIATVAEVDPGTSWIMSTFVCKDGETIVASGTSPVAIPANKVIAAHTITCEVTNTKKGKVVVQKKTVGATGAFSFGLTGQTSQAYTTLSQGSFETAAAWANVPLNTDLTPTETTSETGWNNGTFTCLNGTAPITIPFKVQAGETITCQITNTKQAKVIVQKKTVGALGAFSFGLTGSGVGTQGFTTTQQGVFQTAATFVNVPVNVDLTPTETTGETNWINGTFTCSNAAQQAVTIPFKAVPGDVITCEVTNTKKGKVVVQKKTIGGTGAFSFGLSGQSSQSFTTTQQGVFQTAATFDGLTPGSFTVSESTNQSGWTNGTFTCDGQNTAPTFTVDPGETVTCQVTNIKNGGVIIQKKTVGATGAFSFGLTGQTSQAYTTLSQGSFETAAAWANVPLNTDLTPTETTSETGWNNGTFTCLNGTAPITIPFKVQAGETITCQITNTKQAKVIVQKKTVGALGAFSFGLTGSGVGTQGFTTTQQGVFQTAATFVNVPVNVDLTPTETTGETNWINGTFTCSNAAQQAVTIPFKAVPGDVITCEVTNTKKGKVVVQKKTIGGTGAFSFGLSGQSSQSFTTTQQGVFQTAATFDGLTPGSFTVSESTNQSGWTNGTFTCDGQNTAPTFTVDPGETVTCQVTNIKNGGVIIQKKTVGATGAFSFGLTGQTSQAYTTLSQGSFETAAAWANVPLNTDLTPTETTSETGWNNGTFTCLNGTAPVTIPFKVQAGETITCQITNTKKGTLQVIKTTLGGYGTFGFTATGQPGRSVTTDAANNPKAADAWTDLMPGTFTVDETNPGTSWIKGTFVCTVDGEDEPIASGSGPLDVRVAPGNHVICAITNTKKGTVIVQKKTVGATGSFSFGLTGQAGQDHSTSAQDVFETAATWTNLTPGAFTVSETANGAHWINGSFTCDGGNTAPTFTVDPGETVTCQVTNTKKATIIVEKKTVPADDSTEFNFSGAINANLTNGETASAIVVPGEKYSVTETLTTEQAKRWKLASIECGPINGKAFLETATAEYSPSAGQEIKCTFTNTTKPATITVIKKVGDTPTAGWKYDLALTDAGGASFSPADETTTQLTTAGVNGSASTSIVTLPNDGGSISIDEDLKPGYTFDGVTCLDNDKQLEVKVTTASQLASLKVLPGDNVVCTFDNHLNSALVIVDKVIGTKTIKGWAMTASVPADGTARLSPGDVTTLTTATAINADGVNAAFPVVGVASSGAPFTIEEALPEGYKFETLTCTQDIGDGETGPLAATVNPAQHKATLTVHDGDVVHCRFTNSLLPASIGIVKDASTGAVTVNGTASAQITYTITATNTGKVALTNAVVTDTLPGGVVFVSAAVTAGNPGTCVQASGTITCTLDGTLDVSETSTITVVVTVPATAPASTLTNVASATANPPVCPPTGAPGSLAVAEPATKGCPVTGTDDATTTVTVVAGEVATPTTTTSAAPATSAPATTSAAPSTAVKGVTAVPLPKTGSNAIAMLRVALLAMATGAFLVVLSRRRRKPTVS